MVITEQAIVATSLNLAEIIAIHKTSSECVWLRLVIHFIKEKCSLEYDIKVSTILLEDNVVDITQVK